MSLSFSISLRWLGAHMFESQVARPKQLMSATNEEQVMSSTNEEQLLTSKQGTTPNAVRSFTSKPRPESGRGRAMRATFARQRYNRGEYFGKILFRGSPIWKVLHTWIILSRPNWDVWWFSSKVRSTGILPNSPQWGQRTSSAEDALQVVEAHVRRQPLCRNVQWFRGGLWCKAHSHLCKSSLGSRVRKTYLSIHLLIYLSIFFIMYIYIYICIYIWIDR